MGERLEREIEQIIREKGDLPKPSARARRAARQARRPSPSPGPRGFFSMGSGQLLLTSVGLLLVAALLWDTVRTIGYSLVVLAALIFLVGLAAAFGSAPGSRYEKRWRQQPLDHNSGVPLKERIQRWWRRQR